MSFARLVSRRSGSSVSNIARTLLSCALHALVGVIALYGGMGVFASGAAAQAVVATVPAGPFPTNVAVNTVTNTVYVTNESPFTVSVFNGATNALEATIPIPYPDSDQTQVAVNVDSVNNMVYVFTESYMVSVIDGATNTVVTNINLGEDPVLFAMNTATDTIYISGTNEVSVIDGATNTVVTTIPMAFVPGGMAVNSVTNMLYVGSGGRSVFGEYLSVIDGATNTLSSTITLSATQQSESLVAVNSVSNTVFVGTYGPTYVIDGATNAVTTLATNALSAMSFSIDPVTNMVYEMLQYATSAGGTNVAVMLAINGATNTTVATIPEPNIDLVMNTVTNTLYGVNAAISPSTLYEINGTTYAAQTLQLPGSTAYGSVAVNSVTNMLYSVSFSPSPGNLTVINASLTPSDVSVSCAPNSFSYGLGNDTTCTANVTGGTTPTGTLTWTVNGSTWTTSTLSNGSASVTALTSDNAGTYTVSAAYGGDTNNAVSSGSTTVTIAQANPIWTATCSPNPVITSAALTCSATLGLGVTGTVTWPAALYGSPTTVSGGVASFTATAPPTAGTVSGNVVYSGDANNLSESTPLSVVVNPNVPTITTLTSSVNPVTYGASTVLTALVSTGGIPISGSSSVAFTSSGQSIGTGAVSQVSTTNLLPYSAGPSMLGGGSTLAAVPSVPAPDGSSTVEGFNSQTGNPSLTLSDVPEGTYTFSIWLQAPAGTGPYNVSLSILGTPDAGTTCAVTTVWQQCTITATTDTPSSGVQVGEGNAPLVYMWGAQFEQASSAGPYVATNGAAASGSGGIATLTSSSLPVGVDPIIASFSGATGYIASTSSVLSQTVNSPITARASDSSVVLTESRGVTPFIPVTATGGTGTITYAVSPSLPAGLSYSPATGAVSGTPTVVSASTGYTVTTTDTNGDTSTAAFSLTVDAPVTVTTAVASTTLTQNHAAAFTPVTATGGDAPLAFTVSPALPTGLLMSSTNGTVSGTPTATSSATSYTVTATDTNGATGTASFSLSVDASVTATTTVASTTLTEGQAAAAFTPVTATGGDGSLAFTVSPALPAGLAMASTGAVSGTPTVTSAATSYTVTATDTNGATGAATFSLAVDASVTATTAVASSTLTQNHAATAFSPVSTTGGDAPLTFTVSPALPSGLTMATTGTISGTPTIVSSAANYTVKVTDANGATGTATFSLAVDASIAATTAVASTTLTQEHTAAAFTPVTATGGAAPLTYTVSPALPTGLTLASTTGTVSGTPTVVSSAMTYTVTVTDANGESATATFSLTVDGSVTATTAVASMILTQNHASAAFTPVTATGGDGTLTYSVSPALPAGLSFSATTGTISGTPTALSSSTTYTVTVTDINAATASGSFSLTVDAVLTATTTVASTTDTENVLAPVVTPVTGAGGAAPLTYSVSPAMPAGLTYSTTTGAISGTPAAVGTSSSYLVTVTDSNGANATATFNLTINGSSLTATTTIPLTTLTAGTAAASFTPVTVTGGAAPLKYTISPGLPFGMSLGSTSGVISGTPLAALANTAYTLTVTDSTGATASASFSVTVTAAVSATTISGTNTLTENNPTSFTPVAGSGGTAPLSYSVAPTLPAGLSMAAATGTISGTPTVTISLSTFTVTVTDANGVKATKTFFLSVSAPVTATASIPSTTLTEGVAAASFTSVKGAGGAAPLTYSVSPAMPAGLTYSTTTGAISGTPAAVGTSSSYLVTVTDANGANATATFNLTINGSSLTATTAIPLTTLTSGTAAPSFTPVTVTGGAAPLKYTVSPGLPFNMNLGATTGLISGTPLATLANTTYTLKVTDATGATASATFSITVTAAVSATTISATNTVTENNPTSFTPVAGAGGTAPLSYSVSPALPAGLSMAAATGTVSGTPTATATVSTFTVTVTDANGAKATKTFFLSVDSAVTASTLIPSTTLTEGVAAASFTPVKGAGGVGTLTYSVSPALPTGLTFSTSTGAITGTPTVDSTASSYSVTVTDSNGATASAPFSLAVVPAS